MRIYTQNKLIINFDILTKLFLFLTIAVSNLTGIVEKFSNSVIAESLALLSISILMLFLLFQKFKYNLTDYLFIFVVLYSIIITIIYILKGEINITAFVGIYYFTVPCLIYLNRNNKFLKNNSKFYFHILSFFILLNSLYAIYQVINPNAFFAIDGIRARGLMKSTLNYSGILGASFIPLVTFYFRNKLKKISKIAIILIGGFLSMSKGFFTNIILGYFFSFPLQILLNKKINKSQIKLFRIIIIIILIIFCFSIFIFIKYDLFDRFNVLISIFDYKNNESNIARYNYWTSFFQFFVNNPFGYGIGRIASGTSFVTNAVNFESYILDTLYSIGIIGFIYFYIAFVWILKKIKNIQNSANQQALLMFSIGIFIQNLVQVSMLTPATLLITWLTIILFPTYLEQLNERKENSTRSSI